MIVQCPKCKGSGKQVDWDMIGIMNVTYPLFKVMGYLTGDPDIDKERCERCGGKGHIKVKEEDLED